ncbi:hypothetical protein EDF78_104364 [Rahnella sp. BIGb0236]|uniref:hypothetical protein n=1 Tax=Rahnella sp. BIGb0236 TaxID=2485117 RepID=UPI001062210C|nr:hypothetical protein [Rahnella sp. BIGb0236]TDS93309.1 hypothetical protein EDF78_104364 [Rahnella sp. BIGb0236]VTQ56839.1 protein secretion protein GspB [Campylobacter jejuni]
MQNIHLSAYTSHLNKQKVKVAVRRSLRKSFYCLVFSSICLVLGGLAGSYLHLTYLNWKSHRVAVSEVSRLPYKQSPLHYIYKNRTLPAVNQTASIDDNATPEDEMPAEAEDPAETSTMENEVPEDAAADESDDSQNMALEEKSPDMPLQDWLNKAMQEQQQEEKSAK